MSKSKPDPLTPDQVKAVLESLLFVSGDPLPLKRMAEVVEIEADVVKESLAEMIQEHECDPKRGIILMEVAGGYQLRTVPNYAPYVHRFLERKRSVTLTGPALETLAIVAYRQPLTRAEIEVVRGVSVDGVLRSLLDKRLLKIAGVGDGPGKPNLYGTTRAFLEQFGLRSLEDLPPLENIEMTFSSRVSATDEEPAAGLLDAPMEPSPEEPAAEEGGGERSDAAVITSTDESS